MLLAMLAEYLYATFYNRLAQLRHRANVPSNEQAQGPHFHVLLPGEPSVPRSSCCIFTGFLLSSPSPASSSPPESSTLHKGTFQHRKSCFQNLCFSAPLRCAGKSLPRKKIYPFVISLLAVKIHPEMAICTWKKLYAK